MTTVPLKQRQQAQTKIEIRRAAIDLFEQQGFFATTVDEIAEAAGVSARTVYNYFRDKDEVLTFPLDSIIPFLNVEAKRFETDETGNEIALVRAILGAIQADPERSDLLRRANRIVASDPSLDAVVGRQQLEWERTLLATLAHRKPALAQQTRAAVAVSLGRIAMAAWATTKTETLTVLFDRTVRSLDSVRPGDTQAKGRA